MLFRSWDDEVYDIPSEHIAQSVKYLDIHISSNINDLYKLNYIPLMQEIKDNLERWNTLPLTLIGRISAVKMNILPKINYLLSMTPVTPPSGWFSSLDNAVTKFYWKHQKPRIKLAPNFYYYFLLHQLLYITRWTSSSNQPWKDIEESLIQELDINSIPFIDKKILKKQNFINTVQ